MTPECGTVGLPRLPFHSKPVFFALLAFALAGCATTDNALPKSTLTSPVRILLIESPMTVEPGRLEAVLAPDVKHGMPDSEALIKQGRAHAEQYALTSMETALDNGIGYEIIKPPNGAGQEFDKIRNLDLKSPITQEEADWLHETLGADAVLRFGITDYGLTPHAWRTGYITFEVTSTLALAGIIAYSGSAVAKAGAGAYLVQETAEETAEAYAGFSALDVVSRPVRLEAELVQLNPPETVWQTSDTGLSDTSLSRLTRAVSSEERNQQLDQATDNAAGEIKSDFAKAIGESLPRR